MGHENEYQGTGTKWCCFLYVIVYIVAPFLPVRSHFEAGAYISNEYKAVDCLRTNKNNVHTGTRSPSAVNISTVTLRRSNRYMEYNLKSISLGPLVKPKEIKVIRQIISVYD